MNNIVNFPDQSDLNKVSYIDNDGDMYIANEVDGFGFDTDEVLLKLYPEDSDNG